MFEFQMLLSCSSMEKTHSFSFFCVFILILILDFLLVKNCLLPLLNLLDKRYKIISKNISRMISEYAEANEKNPRDLRDDSWFRRSYLKIKIWTKLIMKALVAFLLLFGKCFVFIWKSIKVLFRRLFNRYINPGIILNVFKDDKFLMIFKEEKIKDVNDDLAERLNRYLEKAKPGRAVYINGEWGSGKTYFINHYSCKKKKCYLSLFGVKDKRDFEYRVWRGCLCPEHPSFIKYVFLTLLFVFVIWGSFQLLDIFLQQYGNLRLWKVFCSSLDGFYECMASFSFLKCIAGQLAIFGALCFAIWMLIRFEILKILLKKKYLIFDDFERAEAPCEDVLSWVNEYIEHLKIPVILIGNEEEVKKKIDRGHLDKNGEVFVKNYVDSKEKVFLWEATIKQNDFVVFMSYLDNLGEKTVLYRLFNNEWKNYKKEHPSNEIPFISVFKSTVNGVLNYRIIENCFDEYQFFLDELTRQKEFSYLSFVNVPYFSSVYDDLKKELFLLYCIFEYSKKKNPTKDITEITESCWKLVHENNALNSQLLDRFSLQLLKKILSNVNDLSLMPNYHIYKPDNDINFAEDKLVIFKMDLDKASPYFIYSVQQPSLSFEMIHVDRGTFWMGSPETEAERSENELRHFVKLTKDFWIGKYPVTQKLYKTIMGVNPSIFINGGEFPVECVSFDDALVFCEKLNTMFADKLPMGYRFTLPTEAQWEYACRAGTKTAFSFGDSCNGRECNCVGNFPYGTKQKGPFLEKTSEVGKYGPNPWGICDMHGNVWEWCSDWYGDYESGTPEDPVVDPTGPAEGSDRVVRGGGWSAYAWNCRSSYRFRCLPFNRYYFLGFRLVLSSSSK